MITALVTIGEGYHNFHHQFPMDYRNAIKAYQYDPTKWAIWTFSKLGLASHLNVFPENEVRKGQLTMQLKRLREVQDGIQWPVVNDLPVISWQSCEHQLVSLLDTYAKRLCSSRTIRETAVDTHCWLHPRRF
jgi:stearoyl-CoA desaturase (Delta-9 desaturase)